MVINPKGLNTDMQEREVIPVIINGRKIVEIGHGRKVTVSDTYYEAVCQIAEDAGISCEILNTKEAEKQAKAEEKAESAKAEAAKLKADAEAEAAKIIEAAKAEAAKIAEGAKAPKN